VRELLAEFLGGLGYEVLTADSAKAAQDAIERRRPDLVLSDVSMPLMDGIALCTWLKHDVRTQLTPVVLLTARSDLASRVRGLDAGADDFFAKPFEMVELKARVASLLRLKRLHDELEMKNALLRTLFGRYVSEDVAAEVVREPERYLTVGGEKREVTVLFGDLRGFTPLADGLDPHDVVEILNGFLSIVVESVLAGGGTLDKFRGDGVMAVYGAPISRPDDAARAVRCAVDLQARIGTLRFPRFDDLRLHLGIGINTGVVVAGPIGSPRRMDYTVIGSEVNVAQRFEANAGPGQILITGSTYEQVKDIVRVRELGPLRVPGKTRSVLAYDVLDALPFGA
jgi:adenylate cyclase